MSVSSGSSVYGGDGGQDGLLEDEEEQIDFYAILNVPRDATTDEINKAYRKRSLIFHPDRHPDDEDKKQAEKIFVKLRRAHEVLTNPKQRAVYDELGVEGLDAQGWELVSRSANPENIRKEYEFLQRLKEQELMLQRVHPTSNFVVKSSIAGMFYEEPEERFPPQLLGISLSQSVDCGLTGSDRLGLIGRVKTGNGVGSGSVSTVWKKNIGAVSLENTITLTPDNVQVSSRIARSLFQRSAIIVQPLLLYSFNNEAFSPSLSLIFSTRLRMRWQGSLMLNMSPMGSSFTTTVVHTEYGQPKAIANFTLHPSNSNVRLVYIVREPARDAFTEMAVQLSMFGISPSVNFERRLSRFSRVGASLHFSFPSCMLTAKFKLKTGQANYEWIVVLCDDKDSLTRSVLYGVLTPVFAVQAVKLIFRPWWERAASLFEDNKIDQQAELARQEEANKVIQLMRPTAERIKREEEQRKGVVILEAKYGQCEQSGSRAYPIAGERTVDVTIPLQAMVHDSQLRIYSVKSQLPGFYDPCPNEPKMLQIRYLFREELHAVTVGDEMPVTLPLRAHRVTSNNSH